MSQVSLDSVLEDRGNNYGSFHTQSNLSQTLNKIVTQHYISVRAVPGQPVPQVPNFMAESLHMICHKMARICNGNEKHIDSWQDIAGYAQLVVNILTEDEEKAKEEPSETTVVE